jgi:predicted nucleic acid-binding protein
VTEIARADVVVVDTSVVVNFAKAGALRPFHDYLKANAVITTDVSGELEDWAETNSAVAWLLEQAPWSQPMGLSPELQQKVIDILGFVEKLGEKAALQDIGEVTYVVLAQDLRDSGECRPVLLLDDIRHGKNLATLRGLEVVDTPELIVEMVVAGAITKPLGGKVWRATFSDRSKWAGYPARLADAGVG